MVNIGAYGSNSDTTVFESCEFGKACLNSPKTLHISDDAPLPGTTNPLPFVIVADEEFVKGDQYAAISWQKFDNTREDF